MPIPSYEDIMLPLLKYVEDGQEHSAQEVIPALADEFHLSEDERKELLPSGKQKVFHNRFGWAKTYMQKACLLESPKRGFFKIAERGLGVLRESPPKITNEFLSQFPEFVKFKNSKKGTNNLENEIENLVDSNLEITFVSQKFTVDECFQETGFSEVELKRWFRAIERKKQAVLYGSPGTGKTYIAEHLAKYLSGSTEGFSELVQFHPAYAYEDFIQGIRPQSQDGELKYSLLPGRFLEFCKKAESCQGLCVLIVDEINRANLAQVFGELMYLLEYRDKKIRLAGSNEPFGIPENVRIIGTMNTADRSIALVDHALRRRFAFIEIRPNYDVLRWYHEKNETVFQVDGLIETLEQLNKVIANKHYEVGISYFLTENLAEELEDIWQMEIEPYLEEYFYDQLEKVDEFRWDKIKQQIGL